LFFLAFSEKLLRHPEAKNPAALARIGLAKQRIQSILDREVVAGQKTLEQKISDQGPKDQRVDPHLVGLAIMDLEETNRLQTHRAGGTSWYANPGRAETQCLAKLEQLLPIYTATHGGGFGNLIGDALELIVYKALERQYVEKPRFAYQGHFDLTIIKNAQGRYFKTQPPKSIGRHSTIKEADFLLFGYDAGALCIECKNYREWLYPSHEIIKELIIKATDLNAIPVLIYRRIHYTTIANFLRPAGIIAHESYYQYYPADKTALAADVKNRRLLGFTDVTANEEPHPRTTKFIFETLPKIVDHMAETWNKNKGKLREYADDEINLAQLYTAIDSPAGGKWRELPDEPDPDY
jgi:hypothetical protein